MFLISLKMLSFCILLPISFGVIVTGLPAPPRIQVTSDVHTELQRRDPVLGELSYTIRYKEFQNSHAKRIPKLTESLNSGAESNPNLQYQWDVLIGAHETHLMIGDGLPSFRGMWNETSDPMKNINWPFEGQRGPKSQISYSGSDPGGMGNIYLPKAKSALSSAEAHSETLNLVKVLRDVRFQGGPNCHTGQAMQSLLGKHYIPKSELPLGLESGIERACMKELKEWSKQYPALVRKVYGEAHGAKTQGAKEKSRWKLHRLFQNNCQLYDRGSRDDPRPLESLLEFGQRFCVYTTGEIWSVSDEYVSGSKR
ncbi:hypothetical protein C8R42DRAFT_645519 [Lentinula raphanica]|nr:hypothetical protein C8R42DRAFT_645519 [Lentinula raphanica]